MPDTSMLVYRQDAETPSVAQLLDDVRDLLISARDRGEAPAQLVVSSHLYREVAQAKRREVQRGFGVRLFGLTLLAPDV